MKDPKNVAKGLFILGKPSARGEFFEEFTASGATRYKAGVKCNACGFHVLWLVGLWGALDSPALACEDCGAVQ